ncbi:hypothetical protein SAMN05192539_103163 [Paraburkholderia diazotrophica]|uniref:Uncharacterized protein n=1 Tax=Paraburkholderia diazotrophica TaxID=667676 RepID=A0A1H7DNF0_9BURK|nr:hypothetical protein SAMN05192539_103163 [Paraburkholderia diazotrophica]
MLELIEISRLFLASLAASGVAGSFDVTEYSKNNKSEE